MPVHHHRQTPLLTAVLVALTGVLTACGGSGSSSDAPSGGAGSGGSTADACTPTGSYSIGDVGPGGGLIFYVDDDGIHTSFTYLEAAPADLEEADGIYSWASIYGGAAHFIGASGQAVGTGADNTARIVAYLDQDGQTNRAAQRAAAHEISGCDDWFLPSRDELNLMHVHLYQQGLGDFDDSFTYWSSTEANLQQAAAQFFSSGLQADMTKTNRYRVRPARAF